MKPETMKGVIVNKVQDFKTICFQYFSLLPLATTFLKKENTCFHSKAYLGSPNKSDSTISVILDKPQTTHVPIVPFQNVRTP